MKYAVAYVNLFDNDLTIEIVEADTPKEAIKKHTRLADACHAEWVAEMPEDLEEIKEVFFDGDTLVDVIEL